MHRAVPWIALEYALLLVQCMQELIMSMHGSPCTSLRAGPFICMAMCARLLTHSSRELYRKACRSES